MSDALLFFCWFFFMANGMIYCSRREYWNPTGCTSLYNMLYGMNYAANVTEI